MPRNSIIIMENLRLPFLGEIVHYHPVEDDRACRLNGATVCAALVNRVHDSVGDPGNINLRVFVDGEAIIRKTSILKQVDGELGTWSFADEASVAPVAEEAPETEVPEEAPVPVVPTGEVVGEPDPEAPAEQPAEAPVEEAVPEQPVPEEPQAPEAPVEDKADEAPVSEETDAAPASQEEAPGSAQGTADASDEAAGDQPPAATPFLHGSF